MVCTADLQEARFHQRVDLVYENVGDVGEGGLEVWGADGKGGMGIRSLVQSNGLSRAFELSDSSFHRYLSFGHIVSE